MKNKKENDFQCFESYMLMKKTKNLITEKFKTVRNKCGLKSIDIQVLYYIYWEKNKAEKSSYPVKLVDISENMDINKGQVSTSLDRLYKDNYLEAEVSERDKRITYYKLSKSGNKICLDCDKKIKEFNDRISLEATREELAAFYKVFKIYLNGINTVLEDNDNC